MRRCWQTFSAGTSHNLDTVGQEPTELAVGAGGGSLDIFTLVYPFSPLSSSLWEAARYRLKYCLKGPGWSGGAMVLGIFPVPGRHTNLDDSRARAYCACGGSGGGCLDIFNLFYHFSFLSPSLWETARYRLKYCLKGPLSPKQPTKKNFKGPLNPKQPTSKSSAGASYNLDYTVGQWPTALEVGAGGGCLDIFTLI